MMMLSAWVAGAVTAGAGGFALGYLLGRGHRRLPPLNIGRRRN